VDNPTRSESNQTTEIIKRFNEVFLRHDPSALDELVAEDCVIENTQPAPNGAREIGREACIARWTEIATTPGTRFDLEDVLVAGDHAIIRWRYWWGEGESSSVRGVNLMRVRHGQIVEAMGYVKGA
jgi:ketosteroid isomerase-like protein